MSTNLPAGLLDAVAKRACVAFVGSGFSVPAGMPTWKQLLGELIQEGERQSVIEAATGEQLRSMLADNRLLEVAEHTRIQLGAHHFGQVLRRKFAISAEPTRNHKLLVDTPYRAIMTTNYDKLIETAYTLRWRSTPRTITWSEPGSLGSVLYDEDFFVFKLHGDVDNSESIILTRRDYDEIMFRNAHVRTLLQAILLTNTIVFIGYSLQDPDFDMVMAEVSLLYRGTTPLSYALLPSNGGVLKEQYKERMNIQVIPYDPRDNHVEVTQTLETIRAAGRNDHANDIT
ncbi:MAG: hypothetical protein GY835_03040 [bacterium]|nr:hypothetical protein [bacterium]